MNTTIFDSFEKHKLIPVIEIPEVQHAEPLGEALLKGGLPLAEITFRTDCAAQAIKTMGSRFNELIIGAGTVLTIDQVKAAIDAGARFIVSPGIDAKVVEYCMAHYIPITPGAITPSEIQLAIQLGIEIIKFFPAEAAGGLNYLKAISGPFNKIRFIPTGGINQDNITGYLGFNKVLACGGSWIAPKKLISEKRFDEIASLTEKALQQIKESK
ncbi:MAG: bifunctional 4-hydroxy-2-oxoglutarate aldolase/2-dehydro-3-deoxy-phosphogluconate aldolase [Spirochaetales bacterium]|nr:bifunctional 4-hydroxy-2-oxoglutarate aldolase/2-dehydro-3-deoxy-phosphogluconate aldolase [Spirochaetales bacterium]